MLFSNAIKRAIKSILMLRKLYGVIPHGIHISSRGIKLLWGDLIYKRSGEGFYILNNQMFKLNINKNVIVLDVGSGYRPCVRADILIDKFLSDTRERRRIALIDDRPFIKADACLLSFQDNSLEYIYCSHVLEHVFDPARVMNEFKRVARKGYIETRSAL